MKLAFSEDLFQPSIKLHISFVLAVKEVLRSDKWSELTEQWSEEKADFLDAILAKRIERNQEEGIRSGNKGTDGDQEKYRHQAQDENSTWGSSKTEWGEDQGVYNMWIELDYHVNSQQDWIHFWNLLVWFLVCGSFIFYKIAINKHFRQISAAFRAHLHGTSGDWKGIESLKQPKQTSQDRRRLIYSSSLEVICPMEGEFSGQHLVSVEVWMMHR